MLPNNGDDNPRYNPATPFVSTVCLKQCHAPRYTTGPDDDDDDVDVVPPTAAAARAEGLTCNSVFTVSRG
jgi:hypothetical protein